MASIIQQALTGSHEPHSAMRGFPVPHTFTFNHQPIFLAERCYKALFIFLTSKPFGWTLHRHSRKGLCAQCFLLHDFCGNFPLAASEDKLGLFWLYCIIMICLPATTTVRTEAKHLSLFDNTFPEACSDPLQKEVGVCWLNLKQKPFRFICAEALHTWGFEFWPSLHCYNEFIGVQYSETSSQTGDPSNKHHVAKTEGIQDTIHLCGYTAMERSHLCQHWLWKNKNVINTLVLSVCVSMCTWYVFPWLAMCMWLGLNVLNSYLPLSSLLT